MPRLAIIGLGKMGRTVEQLAHDRAWEIVARIDPEHGAAPTVNRDTLHEAEVAIEFTTPDAAPANIRAAVAAGCPIVVGTTGWDAQRADIERMVRDLDGTLLSAPNFSLGVAAFMQIVEAAASTMRHVVGFDARLTETHHTEKKDAPSGTAVALARLASAKLGRDIPITSVRTGAVTGVHELVFDAPFEQIRLEHVARDRRVFANGALLAARWLIGRRGVFTLQDVLSFSADSTT
jgi:4-hydroxy-tetrahydrodipicolinate reductase